MISTPLQGLPSALDLAKRSLAISIYDTRWVPDSARLVVVGAYARGTGSLQVLELEGSELKTTLELEKATPLKCGTFAASGASNRHLATGSFGGRLQVWDLERPADPLFDAAAHSGIVNAIDGFGGKEAGCGAPELASCGRDGAVRVWDPRQRDSPVAAFEPASPVEARDAWCVAFGNAFNENERCLLAGYDNGDVKMFDLRTNTVRWETNVGHGVCGVQFDRQDIVMNKFVVTCLESHFHAFDARTQHHKQGFAGVHTDTGLGATVWGCRHLPQSRDVFMLTSGDGTLSLLKYEYPDKRVETDSEGHEYGVAGKTKLLCSKELTSQPVVGFDWSPDRMGLFCCGAMDQCVRVGQVTKLSTL